MDRVEVCDPLTYPLHQMIQKPSVRQLLCLRWGWLGGTGEEGSPVLTFRSILPLDSWRARLYSQISRDHVFNRYGFWFLFYI